MVTFLGDDLEEGAKLISLFLSCIGSKGLTGVEGNTDLFPVIRSSNGDAEYSQVAAVFSKRRCHFHQVFHFILREEPHIKSQLYYDSDANTIAGFLMYSVVSMCQFCGLQKIFS